MRRHLFSILGLALAVSVAAPAAAEIRIGFAYPLSGPHALSGARSRIAAEMAVHDLNAKGGVLGQQVTLVTADDACGLQRSVEAAHELVKAEVSLVVGHMCSHSSLLAAGIYETADILMITPGSTHPRLTEEGRQNVFRLIGRDDEQGRLAGDFLAERWAGRRIAILHDGSAYGEGLGAQARKQLRVRGELEAIYDVYTPGAEDYGELAARLLRARIDVLYLGGYGAEGAQILRALRARGGDLQLVGGDGLNMDEFWNVAGPAAEGTIFTSRRDPSRLKEAAEVLAGFIARGLGSRPTGLSAYAAVQVWAQAVERAGTVRLAAVADTLHRGRFKSVLGPIAFDGKGDLLTGGWQWQIWRDGTYEPLTWSATTH